MLGVGHTAPTNQKPLFLCVSVCVTEKRDIGKGEGGCIMWTMLVFLTIKVLDIQTHINKDENIHTSEA